MVACLRDAVSRGLTQPKSLTCRLAKGMIAPIVKNTLQTIVISITFFAVAMGGKQTTAQITYHGCGLTGSSAPPIVQQLNYMKNRWSSPKTKDIKRTITLEAVLAAGKDTNRWSDNNAAEIEGVVFDVKAGGIESTNCRAQDLAERDTHIEIVRSLDDSGPTRRMIVEVTPRLRAIAAKRGVDWSTEGLQKLIGHKVKISGWMLFDFEHIDEAENTGPKRRDNWRATAWEIHPVTDITVLD